MILANCFFSHEVKASWMELSVSLSNWDISIPISSCVYSFCSTISYATLPPSPTVYWGWSLSMGTTELMAVSMLKISLSLSLSSFNHCLITSLLKCFGLGKITMNGAVNNHAYTQTNFYCAGLSIAGSTGGTRVPCSPLIPGPTGPHWGWCSNGMSWFM